MKGLKFEIGDLKFFTQRCKAATAGHYSKTSASKFVSNKQGDHSSEGLETGWIICLN